MLIYIGGGDVGHELASHADVHKISFTGSTSTGRKIQEAAAKSNLKRVTLELGGKSPAVVFEDAEFTPSVAACTFGITANTGQTCAATSRLFVQESIADRFIEEVRRAFEGIAANIGADPLNPGTQYGPLVDKSQFERVRSYVEEASASLSPLVGGATSERPGYHVAPTIFLNPADDSKIYREEIFGPILCIRTFKTEEEAIERANDTDYGLAGE